MPNISDGAREEAPGFGPIRAFVIFNPTGARRVVYTGPVPPLRVIAHPIGRISHQQCGLNRTQQSLDGQSVCAVAADNSVVAETPNVARPGNRHLRYVRDGIFLSAAPEIRRR